MGLFDGMLCQQILHSLLFCIVWHYMGIYKVRFIGYYDYWIVFSVVMDTQTWALEHRGGLSALRLREKNSRPPAEGWRERPPTYLPSGST